jgi:hypothetical protein
MPSSSVTLLNFSVKNLSRNNGHFRFVAEICLSDTCKGISRKTKGFEIIYIPKKRKMDKEEKEVDEQEEFNAKEEVDFKKE